MNISRSQLLIHLKFNSGFVFGEKRFVRSAVEGESDFVAYENHLPGHGQFGVMMHILDADIRGPWFIRDYGMALFNPTWTQSISVAEGESWTVSLRVVAYDGELTDERAQAWIDI